MVSGLRVLARTRSFYGTEGLIIFMQKRAVPYKSFATDEVIKQSVGFAAVHLVANGTSPTSSDVCFAVAIGGIVLQKSPSINLASQW